MDSKKLSPSQFPALLREITDPPKTLYARGETSLLDDTTAKFLTIVGSRNCTSYGKDVVRHLVEGLTGHNVVIVSGLALGIDGEAHKAALRANLKTVAIPGSGLDDTVLYPRSHASLAREILKSGGLLLSEYEPTQKAAPWTFPRRNRLLVGISHAVLVIEASERSGTLITARLTTDYNRDLLVVPGSIFSPMSRGAHQFIKLGATPISEPSDIIRALGITEETPRVATKETSTLSEVEQQILSMLSEPRERDEVIARLKMPVSEASVVLSKLELLGRIEERFGTLRRVG